MEYTQPMLLPLTLYHSKSGLSYNRALFIIGWDGTQSIPCGVRVAVSVMLGVTDGAAEGHAGERSQGREGAFDKLHDVPNTSISQNGNGIFPPPKLKIPCILYMARCNAVKVWDCILPPCKGQSKCAEKIPDAGLAFSHELPNPIQRMKKMVALEHCRRTEILKVTSGDPVATGATV